MAVTERSLPAERTERAAPDALADGPDIKPRAFRIGLAFALVVAGALRMRALTSDFPLNDGGMFYTMTRDLQTAGYRLPSVTTYNHASIPFAYPPLGFYLTGFLDSATPMSLFTAYRLVPFASSLLTVIAFAWLAAAFLGTRRATLFATVMFAVLPLSYRWMIMGGSVTRAPGFLFAILALRVAVDMYREARFSWRVPALGVLAALTLLSHIETAWFLAVTLVLFGCLVGRPRAGVTHLAMAGLLSLALAAPWWAIVVTRHGLGPFEAAMKTGNWSYVGPLLSLLQVTRAEPGFPVIAALACLGIILELARRRYLIPGWVLVGGAVDPRAFPNFSAVPLAILAAIAVCELLEVLSQYATGVRGSRLSGPFVPPAWLIPSALAIGLIFAALSSYASNRLLDTAVTADERGAMTWVASNTPENARVLVVTGEEWSFDRSAEWLPTLTGRRSVATVQGTEWLGGGAYHRSNEQASDLRKCAFLTPDCLITWQDQTHNAFDYVYITKAEPRQGLLFENQDCCAGLRVGLKNDPSYAVVYDGPGATIFKLTNQNASLAPN